VNTDGPVIDGRDRRESRVNLDGPIIDGRDKERSAPTPEKKGPQRDANGRFIKKSKPED